MHKFIKALPANAWWLIIVAVCSVLIAFRINWEDALVGILTDLFAAAVGVWVAIKVVEMTLKQQRDREWSLVRSVLKQSIQQVSNSLVLAANRLLPDQNKLTDVVHLPAADDSKRVKILVELQDKLSHANVQFASDQVEPLYMRSSQELRRIRDGILPMAVASDVKLQLLEQLQLVDKAGHELDIAYMRVRYEKITPPVVLEKFINLLASQSQLETYLNTLQTGDHGK